MTVLTFDISGSQIDGARDYQEDAFLIAHLGDSDGDSSGSLVIVADGMGGHAAGNVASNMAVQTFATPSHAANIVEFERVRA